MATSLKVLVVDDDPISLEIIETVISGLGHTVLTRDRALGTSVEIQRERPDVVLLDVNMPALPGDELLRVIQKQRRAGQSQDWEPRFIFVSGNDSETLARLVEETGALGAIQKSDGPLGIASAFRKLLGV